MGLFADYERIPAGIQFKYPLPAGKDELKIIVSDFSGPEKERVGRLFGWVARYCMHPHR